MIIHQIFLSVNNQTFEDYNYHKNSVIWQEWCKKNNYQYILHDEDSIYKIMNEKDKIMSERVFNENRDPFINIDWAKYIVINHYGGVYVDLDVLPTSKSKEFIESQEILFGCWKHGQFLEKRKRNNWRINNNFLKFNKGQLRDCLNYLYSEYDKKSQMEIYDRRLKRFIFQVAGPLGFSRWCKQNKYHKFIRKDFFDYFDDLGTNAWLD